MAAGSNRSGRPCQTTPERETTAAIADSFPALRARGRLRHVRMRRRWRCAPDLNIRLATGGALDRPALVDEAPVLAEVAREPVEVEVACVRPPGIQARQAGHER